MKKEYRGCTQSRFRCHAYCTPSAGLRIAGIAGNALPCRLIEPLVQVVGHGAHCIIEVSARPVPAVLPLAHDACAWRSPIRICKGKPPAADPGGGAAWLNGGAAPPAPSTHADLHSEKYKSRLLVASLDFCFFTPSWGRCNREPPGILLLVIVLSIGSTTRPRGHSSPSLPSEAG